MKNLELGQLWRCPVEWCAVWKGSVSDFLGHLYQEHSEVFPSMDGDPVDVWQMTLHPDVSGIAVDARLFHEAGCRLVHIQVPGLQGSLSSSGTPRGNASSTIVVCGSGYGHRPAHTATHFYSCVESFPGPDTRGMFPGGTSSWVLTSPRRVSFASDVTVLSNTLPPNNLPNIVLHDPPCLEIAEGDEMDTGGATEDITATVVPPPPGFRQLSWPREEWSVGSKQSLLVFAKGLPGWFPWRYGEQPVDPPSLPLSPILQGSLDDSVIANVR